MSILKQQSGNVVVILIAAAMVLSAIFFEFWRRTRLVTVRADSMRLETTVDLLVDTFRARLQNPETCEKLLRGSVLSPGDSRPVELNYVFDSEFMRGIELVSTAVEIDEHPDMDTQIEMEGELVPFVRFPARLVSEFRASRLDRAGTPHGDPVAIRRAQPFLAWVDGGGKMKACFGVNSAGSICNDLGGFFFSSPPAETPYDQSCRQSIHTRRLAEDGRATPIGTCRLARGGPTRESCEKVYGSSAWKSFRLQDAHPYFEPEIQTGSYMCMRCQ